MTLHTEDDARLATEPARTRPAEGAPARPLAPPAPIGDEPVAAKPARRRPPIALLVVAVLALLLIGLGARQWSFGRNHVTTDDAQVDGHIVPVLARVSGYVAEVRASENSAVRAGDTLVVLDDRDYQSRLLQAEGDLASAVATAGSAGAAGQAPAQLAAARAAVVQAEANDRKARADLERMQTLAARGIASRQQLDAAEATAATAAAQLQAAHDQVAAAAAGVRGAGARVEAARAALDQARLQLSYARIVAPGNGVVSRKSVELGQLVQPGQPLMNVVPLDDVWVTANYKETEIRDVTAGDAAVVEVDSYPGRRFLGHVESLSPATGAKFSLLPPDNSTGNFTKVVQRIPVRIRLDGPVDPRHPLRPGMSVKAVVTTR